PLDDGVAQAIMDHRFTPLKKLIWRNSSLQYGSIDRLIASLEMPPDDEILVKARDADDLLALKALGEVAEVAARANDGPSVRLLWDVCCIPDFRGISHGEHAGLLEVIFNHLHERGKIPDDWLARQIKRIDNPNGDIDAIAKRLAFIRTWTYVAQRKSWTSDDSHWRDATRAVEDRLSDALHSGLMQRFVDRRTSVLLRRLGQKEAMVADVSDTGDVTVEGEFVGRLDGFRFTQDQSANGAEAKTVKTAALQALAPHFHLRADRFYNAPDTEIDFTEQGGLMWGKSAVGKLVSGGEVLKPRVEVFVDDVAGAEVAEKVQRRLQHFVDRKIAALFEPMLDMQKDEALVGLAKGFAFRLVEGFGLLVRGDVADDVKALDQDARGLLRKHGVRFGQFTIFMPALLKPAPTRLRLVLWSLAQGLAEFPEAPPPGLVTIPADAHAPKGADTMSGYRIAGERAIRIDMLERLADLLRSENSRGGFEANPDMLSITGMTLDQFSDLMKGLGYRAERGERPKVKAAPAEAPKGADTPAAVEEPNDETLQPATNTVEAAPETADAAPVADGPEVTEAQPPEVEVFYTFTWGGNRGARTNRPPQQGKGKPKGKRPQGKGKGAKPQGARSFEARPPKKDKPIDPDSPFAALAALKDKS
ncbi:MAG: disulfide oxidoreductase, partial [Pseudomonadota bacterium]